MEYRLTILVLINTISIALDTLQLTAFALTGENGGEITRVDSKVLVFQVSVLLCQLVVVLLNFHSSWMMLYNHALES